MDDIIAYLEEKWAPFVAWMNARYPDHGEEMAEKRYEELKAAESRAPIAPPAREEGE